MPPLREAVRPASAFGVLPACLASFRVSGGVGRYRVVPASQTICPGEAGTCHIIEYRAGGVLLGADYDSGSIFDSRIYIGPALPAAHPSCIAWDGDPL